MFKAVWRFRQFLLSSIRRDLFTQFVRSKLGGLWVVLHPLAQVAIYTLVLAKILSARLPDIDSPYAYAIYLLSGLIAWTLFSDILSRSIGLFVGHGHLMKQVNFPRITLPIIVAGVCGANNLILMLVAMAIFWVLGQQFTLQLLWLIPLSGLVVMLSLGLGLILGTLNVFVRDIGQIVPVVLQMMFWLTPIVYPKNIVPEEYREWLAFNPMINIVEAYHSVIVYGRAPDLESLATVIIAAFVLCALSLLMFRRASPELVDAL